MACQPGSSGGCAEGCFFLGGCAGMFVGVVSVVSVVIIVSVVAAIARAEAPKLPRLLRLLRLLSVVSVVAAIARAEALRLRWVIAVIERRKDIACQPGSSHSGVKVWCSSHNFLISWRSRFLTSWHSLDE